MMKKCLIANAIFCAWLTLASAAEARTSYDGPWNLVFYTQQGSCDPTFTFSVNVDAGVVTHPNLVKFRGHVAKSGAVRASVTVQDKYASGSGKLTGEIRPRHVERPRGWRKLFGILDRCNETDSNRRICPLKTRRHLEIRSNGLPTQEPETWQTLDRRS